MNSSLILTFWEWKNVRNGSTISNSLFGKHIWEKPIDFKPRNILTYSTKSQYLSKHIFDLVWFVYVLIFGNSQDLYFQMSEISKIPPSLSVCVGIPYAKTKTIVFQRAGKSCLNYLVHFGHGSQNSRVQNFGHAKFVILSTMNTFWPRVAKVTIIFAHALILVIILATCCENHHAFWPRLNFGHPSVLATHFLCWPRMPQFWSRLHHSGSP